MTSPQTDSGPLSRLDQREINEWEALPFVGYAMHGWNLQQGSSKIAKLSSDSYTSEDGVRKV